MDVILRTFLPIVVISFIGAVIQTSTGFGYGIFVMAIFPAFLEYTDALVASGLTSLFLTTVNVILFRKSVQIKKVIVPFISYSVFSVLGTLLLRRIYFQIGEEAQTQADAVLKRVLGIVLIVLALYLLLFSAKIRIKPSVPAGLTAGGLGGAMNSLFGMGGPPIVAYFLSVSENNVIYLAAIHTYFFLGSIYTTVLRGVSGMITKSSLFYTLFSVIALIPGIVLGRKIFKKMNQKTLKLVVYGYMIVMGCFFLIRG